MITLITQEYSNSPLLTRTTNTEHAHKLGLHGGFYKVQLVNDSGVVIQEYK